ncbi:MAG: bile acid:sodium symporter [Acetobacteraceae bacterium]
MSTALAAIRRIVDTYLVALICTVVLAALLPARAGVGAVAMDQGGVCGCRGAVLPLRRAAVPPGRAGGGSRIGGLQSLVFASTFILFPAIGLLLTTVLRPWLTPELSMGLMFVCVLPSTVQVFHRLHSIARGNVSAALCSASVSNLVGMVLTRRSLR